MTLHSTINGRAGARDTARDLSELLLAVYAGSNEMDIEAFMPNALGALRQRVRFDGAWWGMRGAGDEAHRVYFSYTQGVPSDMARLWRTMCESDERALPLLTHAENQTSRFDADVLHRMGHGPRWLAQASGGHNVLCSQSTDERLGHHMFLCLFRQDTHDVFDEGERYLKELAMPHLQCAMMASRDTHLRRMALQSARAGKHWAVVDPRGAVNSVGPGFNEALRQGWPDWCGPLLPLALRVRFAEPTEHWLARGLAFESHWAGDLALVSVSAADDSLDRLSPREQAVAEAFGSGLSYKAVAQQLEMAPATVRHHLRNVYAKLGVGNKAAIVRLVSRDARQREPSFI